jgi:hypothetical protein
MFLSSILRSAGGRRPRQPHRSSRYVPTTRSTPSAKIFRILDCVNCFTWPLERRARSCLLPLDDGNDFFDYVYFFPVDMVLILFVDSPLCTYVCDPSIHPYIVLLVLFLVGSIGGHKWWNS